MTRETRGNTQKFQVPKVTIHWGYTIGGPVLSLKTGISDELLDFALNRLTLLPKRLREKQGCALYMGMSLPTAGVIVPCIKWCASHVGAHHTRQSTVTEMGSCLPLRPDWAWPFFLAQERVWLELDLRASLSANGAESSFTRSELHLLRLLKGKL